MALDAVAGHGDEVIHLNARLAEKLSGRRRLSGATNVAVQLERYDAGRLVVRSAGDRGSRHPAHRRAVHQQPGQSDRMDGRRRERLPPSWGSSRRHGLWIIADEIYALFCYGGQRRALLPPMLPSPKTASSNVNTSPRTGP